MPTDVTPRVARTVLLILFGLGLAARLATLLVPTSYFPDEIFQYLEVAHRQVFGYGAVTWEQRIGVRSPVFPLLLTLPMGLGHALAPDGYAYLILTKAMLALASLGVIWGSFALGRIVSTAHGLITAFVATVWFEFIYFSTQALTETFALALIFPAAALFLDTDRATPRRDALAGFLLAAAAVIRFQYGPALVLFALLCCGRNPRKWLFTSLGAVLALAVSAAIDLSSGQIPFGWMIANFDQNILQGRSHMWVEDASFYPLALITILLPFLPIYLVVGWSAMQRFPALALAAGFHIILHSMIAHKEYRYILMSSAILIVLAAIGSVDLLTRHRGEAPSPKALILIAMMWASASLVTGVNGLNRPIWARQSTELRAFKAVHADAKACGLAVVSTDGSAQGGYSYLHRPLPLYMLDIEASAKLLARTAPAFNRVLLAQAREDRLPAEYTRQFCGPTWPDGRQVCLYARPGGCIPRAAQEFDINRLDRRVTSDLGRMQGKGGGHGTRDDR